MSCPRNPAFAGIALIAALSAASSAQTPLTSLNVATGFDSPTDIQAPPGDLDRLFVVEQPGTIRVVELDNDYNVRGRAFLNIRSKVLPGSERGLLGLAFHPDYANNGYFYVNYTNLSGNTVIERYTVSSTNPNVADDTSGAIILGPVTQPFSNHNAGQLQFGPDGYLYIGFGDGGSSGDPGCRAQNGALFLGKMLRIDVDGGFPYVIPPTNPFIGDPNVLDEIWAVGLRNPWRYCFDRGNGDLYIADVGQDNWEEVDYQPASSLGGENWGWKIMEGTHCFGTGNCDPSLPACNDPLYLLPVHEYSHGQGCSITGGYVYRGCAIPDLAGTYFFADYCSSRIWSFEVVGGVRTNFQERTNELQPSNGGNFSTFTTFGEDACGEVYLAGAGGDLFKVVPNVPPPANDLGFAKKGANGEKPILELCGLLDAGNFATLRLRRGPANQRVLLFVADQMNPTSVWGGTLVPIPWLLIMFQKTDSKGTVETFVPGGLGAITIYLQYVLQDPGNTFNTGFSNALEVFFQ